MAVILVFFSVTMQGGIQAIFSHGNVLKNAVLQHVRVVTPSVRALMFLRHESTSAARIEEHGFESTKISDVLTAKGKGADGSWLWCTTDDSVYDAVKSVKNLLYQQFSRVRFVLITCEVF